MVSLLRRQSSMIICLRLSLALTPSPPFTSIVQTYRLMRTVFVRVKNIYNKKFLQKSTKIPGWSIYNQPGTFIILKQMLNLRTPILKLKRNTIFIHTIFAYQFTYAILKLHPDHVEQATHRLSLCKGNASWTSKELVEIPESPGVYWVRLDSRNLISSKLSFFCRVNSYF